MNPTKLLLVGGVDRSGTTMLGAALGATSGATVVPESQFLIELLNLGSDTWTLDRVISTFAHSWRFQLWDVDVEELRSGVVPEFDGHQPSKHHIAATYAAAARLYGKRTGQEWNGLIVDHTPSNCRYAFALARIFPIAGIVHVVRDGRAVWNSMKSLKWGPSTPSLAAQFWMSRLVHGLLLESEADAAGHHTWAILRTRYEDVLAGETFAEPASILASLGIESRAKRPDPGRFVVPTYSAEQHGLVDRGIEASRADAWLQLPANEIQRFEAVAGEVLELLGYTREYPSQAGGYQSRWMIEDAFVDLWAQQVRGRVDSWRRRRSS